MEQERHKSEHRHTLLKGAAYKPKLLRVIWDDEGEAEIFGKPKMRRADRKSGKLQEDTFLAC